MILAASVMWWLVYVNLTHVRVTRDEEGLIWRNGLYQTDWHVDVPMGHFLDG